MGYYPNGCQCSDFTFFNGVETVGNCLTGQDYGFCYVHIPTSCPDRSESESFKNFFNPEESMYISFTACHLRADPFRRFGLDSGRNRILSRNGRGNIFYTWYAPG